MIIIEAFVDFLDHIASVYGVKMHVEVIFRGADMTVWVSC